MSGRTKVFLGLGILVLVAGIASLALRPPSPKEQLRALSVELRALKDSAEACSASLAGEQEAFKRYEARVDSIRRRIASFESLLGNGVPGDSYPKYLATVDSFNAAVPEWQPIADSLAVSRSACEARVEAHRVMADSARALAASLGLLDPTPASYSR